MQKNHKIPVLVAYFITKFQGVTREKSQNFQFLLLTTFLLFAKTAKGIAQHFALNC